MRLVSGAAGDAQASLATAVRERSGQSPAQCYQCGKCTAGCPLAFAMDLDPTRVMRLVQLGQRDAVLKSHTIWLCASCETCTSRCPQGVDLARVMDTLRIFAREAGHTSAEKEVALLNQGLLNSVKSHGRVHEALLVFEQNLKSGHLFRDAEKGPLLMLKGKMGLFGHKQPADMQRVRRLFENIAREEEGQP